MISTTQFNKTLEKLLVSHSYSDMAVHTINISIQPVYKRSVTFTTEVFMIWYATHDHPIVLQITFTSLPFSSTPLLPNEYLV